MNKLDQRTVKWVRAWLTKRCRELKSAGMQMPLGELRESLLAQSEAYSNAARDLPGAVRFAEKCAKRPAKGSTK